ncbi:ribonuclease H-like domain-containing protein, partial [Tanacetum coccineum]
KIPPKTKGSKKKADTDATTKQKPPTVPKEKKGKKTGKGKQKAKELEAISEAVLTEAEQLKIITKRSHKETHSSHTSGSSADEETGVTPGVPDAPDYDSDDDISDKDKKYLFGRPLRNTQCPKLIQFTCKTPASLKVRLTENKSDNSDKSLVEEQVSQVKSSSVEGCEYNTSKSVSELEPKKVRKNNDAPIIEDWVSEDKEQDESMTKPEKKTVIPTAAKIEKPVKRAVRYAEMYISQRPRGNQRNWNGQKSNQLGSEFVMYNKACFNCGSFKHVQKNCTYHKKKVVSGNNYYKVDNYYYAKTSHHRTHKNMTPRAVLLRTGLKSLSTAKPVYTAHPKPTVNTLRPRIVNTARSYRTPVNTVRPRIVNTARSYRTPVNTVRPRIVNTARSYRTPVNTVRPRIVNTARSYRTPVNTVRPRVV